MSSRLITLDLFLDDQNFSSLPTVSSAIVGISQKPNQPERRLPKGVIRAVDEFFVTSMNVKLVLFYPYWLLSGLIWVCIEVSLNVPALRFTTHCEQTCNLFCRKIKRGSGVLTVQILLRIRWWGGTDTSVRTSSFVRGQERWIKPNWYFWIYCNACLPLSTYCNGYFSNHNQRNFFEY